MIEDATPCQFSCTECGRCCRWPGHVLLNAADISRLAEALDLPEDSFIHTYTRLASNRAQLSLTEQPDGACVFLDQDRCRVYEARPAQCRAFPFTGTGPEECPGLTPRKT